MTEFKVLYQIIRQTYRERRELGDPPARASSAAFKAYQKQMKQKTNWYLVIVGTSIIGGLVFTYRWHFGY